MDRLKLQVCLVCFFFFFLFIKCGLVQLDPPVSVRV